VPLAFSVNIERMARGCATNPAKLSRTTPAELFSESSHGVVRERLLIASLSLSLFLLLRKDLRCEMIEENSSVGRTGNRESHSSEGRSGNYHTSFSIPVHNRISIDADLFIHDAEHARQIFSQQNSSSQDRSAIMRFYRD